MKTENTLPCDPTAISSLEEERLRHDAQWGKAIFLIICGWKKKAYMTLCKVRNAFMKILSVQKNTFRSMWAGGEEALWYLLFHKAVEINFLLYSEASVDDQTGVCVAEDSKAGRQAVVLSSARNSMTERTEKMSMLTKVKVGKCSNHFNQNVFISNCLSINCPEMTSKSPEWTTFACPAFQKVCKSGNTPHSDITKGTYTSNLYICTVLMIQGGSG